MKAVILDSYALQEGDLQWEELYTLVQEVKAYPRTPYEEIANRIGDAEIVITNKSKIDAAVLAQCPKLRYVGVTATGVDSLDVNACTQKGVVVTNVPAYSTHSVAQHTFALLLQMCMHTSNHEAAVRAGYWQTQVPSTFGIGTMQELHGKTMGIIGYGDIGKEVAKIALAFGMQVQVYTRTVKEEYQTHNVQFVSLQQLMQSSDVISLHCPATEQTKQIINKQTLAYCKKTAILINTARGALINNDDVASALALHQIGGYATDVLSIEPAQANDPLFAVPNCLITPHIAWTTQEALLRLSNTVCGNIKAFLSNIPQNIINQ